MHPLDHRDLNPEPHHYRSVTNRKTQDINRSLPQKPANQLSNIFPSPSHNRVAARKIVFSGHTTLFFHQSSIKSGKPDPTATAFMFFSCIDKCFPFTSHSRFSLFPFNQRDEESWAELRAYDRLCDGVLSDPCLWRRLIGLMLGSDPVGAGG